MRTININLTNQQISGATKETKYKLDVYCEDIQFYSIEELAIRFEISQRQIERYIRRISEKDVSHYLITINNTRFISPSIIKLNKRYRQ